MSLISGLINKLASNIMGSGNVGKVNNVHTRWISCVNDQTSKLMTSQFAHTNVNKFSFGSLVYPETLETDVPGLGHYMLFYIYRTKNSKYNPAGTEVRQSKTTKSGTSGSYTAGYGVVGIESSTRNDFQANTVTREKRDSIRSKLGL